MSKRAINPPSIGHLPGMAWGLETGGLLVTSGLVALNADHAVVGPNDPAAQAATVFDHLVTILSEAGLNFSDLIKLKCYATSLEAAQAYMSEKKTRMGDVSPASTTIIVAGLLLPDLLIEVEATALSGGAN